MTILSHTIRTRVVCDSCNRAFVHVDGNVDGGLRDAGWVVLGTRAHTHQCPRCARRA